MHTLAQLLHLPDHTKPIVLLIKKTTRTAAAVAVVAAGRAAAATATAKGLKLLTL